MFTSCLQLFMSMVPRSVQHQNQKPPCKRIRAPGLLAHAFSNLSKNFRQQICIAQCRPALAFKKYIDIHALHHNKTWQAKDFLAFVYIGDVPHSEMGKPGTHTDRPRTSTPSPLASRAGICRLPQRSEALGDGA